MTARLKMRKPVIPPGILKSFHSCQYAESISWHMSMVQLMKYAQKRIFHIACILYPIIAIC